jgi:hypothetical protein
LRNFHLRRRYELMVAFDACRAAPDQLSGAEAGEHCELERTEFHWTLDHATFFPGWLLG